MLYRIFCLCVATLGALVLMMVLANEFQGFEIRHQLKFCTSTTDCYISNVKYSRFLDYSFDGGEVLVTLTTSDNFDEVESYFYQKLAQDGEKLVLIQPAGGDAFYIYFQPENSQVELVVSFSWLSFLIVNTITGLVCGFVFSALYYVLMPIDGGGVIDFSQDDTEPTFSKPVDWMDEPTEY